MCDRSRAVIMPGRLKKADKADDIPYVIVLLTHSYGPVRMNTFKGDMA